MNGLNVLSTINTAPLKPFDHIDIHILKISIHFLLILAQHRTAYQHLHLFSLNKGDPEIATATR